MGGSVLLVVVNLLVLAFLACCAGVIYPFWPFGKRINAAASGFGVVVVTFIVMIAFLPRVHNTKPVIGKSVPAEQSWTTTVAATAQSSPITAAAATSESGKHRPGLAVDFTIAHLPVPSDPRASYRVMRSTMNPEGHVRILTERTGPSGVSYTRRECLCPVGWYRVLGEGEFASDAMVERRPLEKFSKLIHDERGGSISYYVCEYGCRRRRN